MILEINIELTTNFLGSGPRINGVRTLKRSPDNRIAINEKEWREDLARAARDLDLNVNMESLALEPGFEFPEINVLRRVYNKTNVDLFEGVSAGNKLNIYAMLDESIERHPKLDELTKMFEIVGKFIGISQFGKKFHCGRFKVLTVAKLGKDDF